uniref:Uncharacterized protein n=1 Tax=Alexandrium andersonii TaxID=327968 RepID=A0A7S2FNT8_9DINO
MGATTPCPSGAGELLRHWSGGEYWRPTSAGTGRWACLALPDVACPDPSERVQAAWRMDRQADDPRNRRLAEEGLNREDMAALLAKQRELLGHGLLAHNFSGCDWARCARGAGNAGASFES